MPVLIEIMTQEAGIVWDDDIVFTFESDGTFDFDDSIGRLRLSTENYAGYRYWHGDVLSIDPIAYRTAQRHGGLVRVDGAGSIEIAMAAFDSTYFWLPDTTYDIKISYSTGLEYLAVCFLTGTAYLNKIDPPLSFGFSIYRADNAVELLTEAENYDGETVPLPMAFGTVSYVKPVRLPDAGGGNQRYAAGGLTGTKHTDWHVFDDGVDICTNATAITADVFELTVAPVGEVTISGTGQATHDVGIFALLTGASWLNLPIVNKIMQYDIDRWQTSQVNVLDFLSELAASVNCFFTIHGGVLHYYDMLSTFTRQYLNVEADTLDGTIYEIAQPLKSAKYIWTSRESVAAPAQMVLETENEETVFSSYPFGTASDFDVFTETRSTAWHRLGNILGWHHRVRGHLSIPLDGTLILPGQDIQIIDDRYNARPITVGNVLYARDIIYDFMNKKVNIEGDMNSEIEA